MMYSNKFVVSLKVGGKVLREEGSTVFLPFGSEYSLFLRNYNNRRAVAKIEIDGVDAMDGEELVIEANSFVDLERFLKRGEAGSGRRFRFIERTSDIEERRGIGSDDGIIRISFRYEQQQFLFYPPGVRGSVLFGKETGCWPLGSISGAVGSTDPSLKCSATHDSSMLSSNSLFSASAAAPGITVEGSESNQNFISITVGPLEVESHVIVFHLLGVVKTSETSVGKVTAPVMVKTKKHCTTCNRDYDSTFEYCPKDSTYLRYQVAA